MRHLFSDWQEFSTCISQAIHVFLLSDYDGTLTPIVSRPEEAVLSPDVRERLIALAEKPRYTVGIISGRSLTEARALVGVDGIFYAGNHGLEIEGPDLKFVEPAAVEARETILDIDHQLSSALEGIEGVIIEDKGLSLTVHYRLVKEERLPAVTNVFKKVTSPVARDGRIRLTSGKKVWEVRPPIDWHKGKAVATIQREVMGLLDGGPWLTIYLGDDTTDEDVFQNLTPPVGWSIFIGGDNPSSAADYYLESTAEVTAFLSRLLELD